jgi:3-deoxy-7-phosphoheptulonate synthase
MTIVVLSSQATPEAITRAIDRLRALRLTLEVSQGAERTILLVHASAETLAPALAGLSGVERIQALTRPYRLAARELRPEGTLVSIGGLIAGAGRPVVIAGPASVFSQAVSTQFAERLRTTGVDVLRIGVYRTPSLLYATPQLDTEALGRLTDLRRTLGTPIAVAPLAAEDVPVLARLADLLIVGPAESANRSLLQACGFVERPVLLTRGASATVDEWLQTADELLGRGNRQLLLAAGGIRTFETATRHTLDLSAVPLVKRRSHLPVLADIRRLDAPNAVIRSLTLAAIASGADGMLLDVTDEPSEGSLSLVDLESLLSQVRRLLAGLR